MGTKLILIRHGATDWNKEKKYCGWTDVPLSKEGRGQARLLAKRLKREKVDKVYSSDRARALSTATIVFKYSKIIRLPELKEMSFGIFEGLTYQEIMDSHGDIYKKWLKNPFSIDIPKGERARNFKQRVLRAFRDIVSAGKNKSIAVVAHGGVISVFVNSILKEDNFWKHIPGSASLSIVEYNNRKAKIAVFNDTSHYRE